MTTPRPPEGKVLDRGALLQRFGRPRGAPLVFTNGVFDLLHRGHVAYLQEARSLGGALVVGINTDASVRRLHKGPERPLVREGDRAYLIASLECVDGVVLFDEDTPEALISSLLPDLLVKGGDYRPEEVAGGEAVRGAGGEVRILPFLPGYSTTSLLQRIREEG